MANNNFIKHYLLPDEEVDSLTCKFGQFIMTESGSMYIDKDDNTRIKLGGGEETITEDEYSSKIKDLPFDLVGNYSATEILDQLK